MCQLSRSPSHARARIPLIILREGYEHKLTSLPLPASDAPALRVRLWLPGLDQPVCRPGADNVRCGEQSTLGKGASPSCPRQTSYFSVYARRAFGGGYVRSQTAAET